ncbi:unnamed protein product [Paramecium primaurelia]|uniref:Large ribosomal subunit protein uL22 n=2 Tax=Paramecium TaxID=5884 RepID=A0A8S1KER3_PARPR|nr:unnamed protein product [Paramecium primaurelia]CAD8052761.1 unnamed protein product [Paramecium primaurelia]CAD8147412.1 unnamed protein product [Paramecium pentaurelia]
MGKQYAREPAVAKKSCKAKASDLRTHFKNTYEVARAIKGQTLAQALKYLQDVLQHKRCVPFTRFNGGVGRTAQAKEFGRSQGRWPEKSVRIVLSLLQNLAANAQVKNLSNEKLIINHVQVNRAQKGRRRTYRAHGRINPFLSSNAHIELWAAEKDENVKKETNNQQVARQSRKQVARSKLSIGA